MSHSNSRRSHQKRQRVSVTSVVAEEPSTTVTRARPAATTATVVEADDDEPTTTRRIRTTAAVEETTSVPVVNPAAPTPASTTRTSTTPAVVPVATVPTTAPVAAAPTTVVAPTPVAPTTRLTTARLASSSSRDTVVASNAPANNATTTSDSSSFPTGAVVGAILGVVALLALVAGYFIWRKKRAARNGALLGSTGGNGYTREKSMDGSDIFPGGVKDRSSISNQEKGSPPQEDFSMQVMPAPAMQQQQASHPAARHSWSQTNNYAGMPLPSPATGPYPQSNSFNSIPHSASSPAGFAPPKAAMMGTPSTRSSVATPYGAIAAAGLASPKLPQSFAQQQQQQQPQQQEDNSPFEDPKWANKLFTVTRTFEPSMPDELVIYPGDTVKIMMAYDDGWVLGENLNAVQNGVATRGVFPRDCVEELSEKPSEPEDAPLSDEPSTLARAPTLPPLNIGRDSQSFTSAMTSSERNSQQARYSRASLVPSIKLSEDPQSQGHNKHLSNASSLNGAIDRFPATPARQLTPVAEDTASGRSVKRTSSLMASKDQDLFAALGDVMGREESASEDEEEEEKKDRK